MSKNYLCDAPIMCIFNLLPETIDGANDLKTHHCKTNTLFASLKI